jgi:hypothetical protein
VVNCLRGPSPCCNAVRPFPPAHAAAPNQRTVRSKPERCFSGANKRQRLFCPRTTCSGHGVRGNCGCPKPGTRRWSEQPRGSAVLRSSLEPRCVFYKRAVRASGECEVGNAGRCVRRGLPPCQSQHTQAAQAALCCLRHSSITVAYVFMHSFYFYYYYIVIFYFYYFFIIFFIIFFLIIF